MRPDDATFTELRSLAMTATEYLNGEYFAKNKSWHAEDSAWKASQVLDILIRNNVQPRTVTEVGCGAGAILAALSHALPHAMFTGHEVSPQAYALCRPTDRVRFVLGDVASRADVLLCLDVFEHVEDYIGFLRGLKDKARHAVFHIPLDLTVLGLVRGTMLRSRFDVGHLHYFTPQTALATLEYCGYRVLDHTLTPAFRDRPGRSIKARLAYLPRRLLYALAPGALATWLGGVSLLVLAE